jgi:hypothetical protein
VAELEPPTAMPKPKLALVPVPDSATVCGLVAALSVMLTAALRDPVAAGVKVMLIVHLAPAATLLPQVLVCWKSLV